LPSELNQRSSNSIIFVITAGKEGIQVMNVITIRTFITRGTMLQKQKESKGNDSKKKKTKSQLDFQHRKRQWDNNSGKNNPYV
jgi:hypothetical protein